MRCWWFWHLLYDNPVFGRRLWSAVRRFQAQREFAYVEHGIFGLNRRWQLEQRRFIIRERGDYKLISPRSRV